AGRSVPDPELGALLSPEGRVVFKNQYWMRRLADGDVVIKEAAPVQVAAKKER
ncbi:MAG TPA: DUF2635 domain-containing protein, partial [Pusillimonas sp.]|nr:DUF2635 domain-containing protein [Pusillimonas sp.]